MVGRNLEDFLGAHRTLHLDTSVFIYFVERHPRYFDLCNEVFKKVEEGGIEGVTSTLTLTEMLVQPYRMKREDIVLKFYALFTTYPHLKWIDISLGISDLAARLRAEYNFRTPDAIQIASALSAGSTGLVCNDKAFQRVEGIECLILSDWIQAD